MKTCKDNECRIAFNEPCDSMVTLSFYLWTKDNDVSRYEQIKGEAEWFTYCPHCGCKVKDLLRKADKTV